MGEPLVSIITPAYNSEKTIEETIDSVLNQVYENWEMIIVNDCSTDKTESLIQTYAKRDNRIKIISFSENRGVVVARNTALEAARGVYVAFLDSDDLWLPKKLNKQIAFMEANQVTFSFSAYELFYGQETQKSSKIIHVPSLIQAEDILKNTIIGCLTVVIHRNRAGPFRFPSLKHGEDSIAWYTLLKNNHKAYGIDEVLAKYRVSNVSLTNNKWKAAKLHWYNYRKYCGFSILKSTKYFLCYAVNAYRKHF